MGKIILRIVILLLIVAVIGLYAYDYFVKGISPTENSSRGIFIIITSIIAFVRTFQNRGRGSLSFYEQQYSEFTERAFRDDPAKKKKLLTAIRAYNENKINRALKTLTKVKKIAQTQYDHYAVDLFAALCFTDIGAFDTAISIYQNAINKGYANSTFYSNLGQVQMTVGDYSGALQNFKVALDHDRKNEYAYNNIAQAHFKMFELDEAVPYALKALEINPKLHQASSLLAIIFAMKQDKQQYDKYFHIAISSGRNPEELKQAVEYFLSNQNSFDQSNA